MTSRPDLTEVGMGNGKQQAGRPFGDPCEFTQWPPIRVITARDDRFFRWSSSSGSRGSGSGSNPTSSQAVTWSR
jgi:hypothetical protein